MVLFVFVFLNRTCVYFNFKNSNMHLMFTIDLTKFEVNGAFVILFYFNKTGTNIHIFSENVVKYA